MHDSWTCVMVEKGPGMIDDEVRAALKMAACDLQLNRWDRMHIVSDVCDGLIETAWKTYNIGGRSGILFRSEIESEDSKGVYKVNFLLSTDDLKRGAKKLRQVIESRGGEWSAAGQRLPCEALYEFHDLAKPGRRLN